MSPPDAVNEERDYGYLQLWDAVAEEVPDREAVVLGDRRLTYAEVREHSTRLGWFLTGLGVGARSDAVADWESPNDLVGLLLRNGPEFLEAALGCYRARCAPFNINFRYQADELAYLLTDAEAAVVVHHLEFAPLVGEALRRSGLDPVLVHVPDGSGAIPLPGSVSWEDAVRDAVEPVTPVVPSPDDVHVLYTGGTTGMPKGVIWRQRELAGRPCGITLRSLEEARDGAPRRGWLRAYPAPPLIHGAASWFAYGAWARGGTLVLAEDASFDARRALDLCRREQVTWMAIVGDAFAQPLIGALRDGEAAPTSLSYIFSSGAALATSAWTELDRWFPGLKLANTFGSSETGPQAVQTSSQQVRFAAGPGTYVVSDDRTTLVTADRPGTGWLATSGELPRGYLGDEVRTSTTFCVVEGVRLSVSGDKAKVDAQGDITFLGRESTVINTGGEKVYSEEVEQALLNLPEIDEALVLGRDNSRWGQEVVALLVGRAGVELTRDDVRDRCAGLLAGYKLPRNVIWVPAIHRHANGKADYDWARALVGVADPVATATEA